MPNKRERSEYNREWREAHAQQLREYEKNRANKAERLLARQVWYQANKARQREYNRVYRALNADQLHAYDIKRNAENKERRDRHREVLKSARREVIEVYGSKCQCCGEGQSELLTIDHINGDGSKHRKESGCANSYGMYVWLKRHGFPRNNYQLLCFNCNWGKSRFGICPHQAKKACAA